MLAVVLGSLLSGCGGAETVQEALGYEQTGPDAMAVVKRPPLILPPDYQLRPPRPATEEQGGDAASDAARETLLGPSSSRQDVTAETESARSLLTGGAPATPAASSAESDGQNLLVARTDRATLDLDSLNETRAENRVDAALLRRLLAWNAADDADNSGPVVKVVARDQTQIDAIPDSAQITSE